MGNHLVSNSAAAINASDDISTVDPDESILSLAKGPRRRQHDDDESESIEEDDLESLASAAGDGKKQVTKAEEERELPAHACAYVKRSPFVARIAANMYSATVAFTILAVSFGACPAASGFAAPVETPLLHTLSIILSEHDIKRCNYTQAAPWAILCWSATTAERRMSFFWGSFPQNRTPWSSCSADSHAQPCLRPKT